MTKNFFAEAFDPATLLKLEIFRRYTREWIPVFLTGKNKFINDIVILDLFSGPGEDKEGNPGSPLIIADELNKFFETHDNLIDKNKSICLIFNDNNKKHVKQLKKNFNSIKLPDICNVTIKSFDFEYAFKWVSPVLKDKKNAKLVILDQYGVKNINGDIFKTLVSCPSLDFIFFIASSFIRRFARQPEIKKCLPNGIDCIEDIEYKMTHKYIYENFRNLIQTYKEYYLSPFSIKKGSNIYGLIFGTNKLLGLKKFLEVAWKLDGHNGEANYNINGDPGWFGEYEQLNLFDTPNIKKRDLFEKEIIDFIKENRYNNKDLFKFVLEKGFLPKHANDILRTKQKEEKIKVTPFDKSDKKRKGSFYISWKNYNRDKPKVCFEWTGG